MDSKKLTNSFEMEKKDRPPDYSWGIFLEIF